VGEDILTQYNVLLFIATVAQSLNKFGGNISAPSLEKSYCAPSSSSGSTWNLPEAGINSVHAEPL